jgi:hypothetical protein
LLLLFLIFGVIIILVRTSWVINLTLAHVSDWRSRRVFIFRCFFVPIYPSSLFFTVVFGVIIVLVRTDSWVILSLAHVSDWESRRVFIFRCSFLLIYFSPLFFTVIFVVVIFVVIWVASMVIV